MLAALFGTRRRSWRLTELGRAAGRPHQLVVKELQRLQSAGLIQVTLADGRRQYEVAVDDPVARDLARFVYQSRGRAPALRRGLRDLPGPTLAWLSRPVRRLQNGDRVDMVVLSALSKRRIAAQLRPVTGPGIAVHALSIQEWVTRLRKKDLFVLRQRRAPKLWILGSPEELVRSEQTHARAGQTLTAALADWRERLSDEWDEDWDPVPRRTAAPA